MNLNVLNFHLIFLVNLICLTNQRKANIIIFVADDLGWDDVSYHGSNQIKTPNIDALAASGIVLDNYYASSVCTPSRGALLSGVHPISSGTQNYVILSGEPRGYPLDIKLLPEYLKDAGYKTHCVGKWHLGFYKKRYTPLFRGFDTHVGYYTGSGDYFDHTHEAGTTAWGLDFRNDLDLITNATGIYSTHYFTKRAIDIIRNHNQSDQLFLYMSYQSVHTANHYSHLQAPQNYINKFPHIANIKRRIFAGMVLAMDESIGIIFDELQSNGLLSNSIVIFTSDNGGPASGFMGNAASNWPLRGVKASLWEGGVRVPGLIWSPLLQKSNYVFKDLFHITDWLPTILEAIDQEQPTDPRIYGISLWKSLSENKPSPRKEILINIDPVWNVSAIRTSKWKLIQGLVFPKWAYWYPPLGSTEVQLDNYQSNYNFTLVDLVSKTLNKIVTTKKHEKLKRTVDCGFKPSNVTTNCKPNLYPCLYDLRRDPCEYNNLADSYPEIVKRLQGRIQILNKTAIEPGNKPIDPKSWPPLHEYSWSFWGDQ